MAIKFLLYRCDKLRYWKFYFSFDKIDYLLLTVEMYSNGEDSTKR